MPKRMILSYILFLFTFHKVRTRHPGKNDRKLFCQHPRKAFVLRSTSVDGACANFGFTSCPRMVMAKIGRLSVLREKRMFCEIAWT
jgi:hypothetical protein